MNGHHCRYSSGIQSFGDSVIIPATQNQFIQDNVFNNAPIRRIAITINKNLDRTLKIQSGIKKLIPDQTEISEAVNRL